MKGLKFQAEEQVKDSSWNQRQGPGRHPIA